MSDVSAEPFWYDCRIGSYKIRYKCWMPFSKWRHLVSYQEYSASSWEPFWHDERIGSFHGQMEGLSHSIMVGGLVPSMSDVSLSHSEVTMGCVPTWLDIITDCHSLNGGTWSVTRNTQFGTEGHSDMTVGCVLTWSDISAGPFWCYWGMCSHLIRYKG